MRALHRRLAQWQQQTGGSRATLDRQLFLHLAADRGAHPALPPPADGRAATALDDVLRSVGPLPSDALAAVHLDRTGRGTRRARGVVFTPEWIVRELVHSTVRPGDRVLDPACGAGVFLVGALGQVAPGAPIAERAAGLRRQLFGVDIDPDAVRVARMSLCLALYEGAVRGDPGLVGPPPHLDDNVLCADILAAEHPRVDAVVGNPPWVRMQAMDPARVAWLQQRFRTATGGNWDQYVLFVERGLELLTEGGRLAFAVPHKWLKHRYGRALRALLAERRAVAKVVHFADQQVFPGASTYTCLLHLRDRPTASVRWQRVADLARWRTAGEATATEVAWTELDSGPWNPPVGEAGRVVAAMRTRGPALEEVAERIFQGLATSADRIHVVQVLEDRGAHLVVRSRAEPEPLVLEARLLQPMLRGADIRRYGAPSSDRRVVLPYLDAAPLDWDALRRQAPQVAAYLTRHEDALRARAGVKPDRWWLFPHPKSLARIARPKLLSRVLSRRGAFTLDRAGGICFAGGGTAGGNGICVADDDPVELRFLLGILNSRPTTIWVRHGLGSLFRDGYRAFGRASLRDLPIPAATPAERASIAARVDRLLEGPDPTTEAALEREVAGLYGLEPACVEAATMAH